MQIVQNLFNQRSLQPKVLSLTWPLAKKTSIALSLLATIVFLPSIIHQQFITGPLVNASLLLASFLLGPSTAMLLGLIPSTVALARGLLPMALAAMVPFIMISNSLYILVFDHCYKRTKLGAIAAASLLKFFFLFTISHKILAVLLPAKLVPKVILMMSWPQLITALAGGLIAHLIIRKRV